MEPWLLQQVANSVAILLGLGVYLGGTAYISGLFNHHDEED